jgi:hypothetical protein
VEIRGLGRGASHMRHIYDWAIGQTRVWGKSRGLEVVGSDVWCKKKSGGSLKGRRGIIIRIDGTQLMRSSSSVVTTFFYTHCKCITVP